MKQEELEKAAKDVYFIIADMQNDLNISFDEAAKAVEIAATVLSISDR